MMFDSLKPTICSQTSRMSVAMLVLATVFIGACGKIEPTVSDLSGTVRISGNPADKSLLDQLQKAFSEQYPGVNFTQSMHGPESTMAGVYTGTADLAFMSREMREPLERMAFEWARLDKPFAFEFANASLTSDRYSTQLGVFVHQSNPLEKLDLSELDGIFGAEHRRGDRNFRAWGELGLSEEWQARRIHVYGPPVNSVQALHFRSVVLENSRKWNPDYLPSDVEGAAVIARLAKDSHGIAYAPVRDANSEVKQIALAKQKDVAYVTATTETVTSRQWPLSRSVWVVSSHTKNEPMTPPVRAFAEYLLSDAAQRLIEMEGGYLPLSAEARYEQRSRLP